jgi:UDP-N-acetylmuramoylalanine--D-glutamate ligase
MSGYETEIGGNIGKPILSLKKISKKGIYILEISSYQLEYSKNFRSKHAAILNISPDHIERHKNINNYVKVKSKIFYAQKKGDFAYINKFNKFSKNILQIIKSKKIKSKLFEIANHNYNLFSKKIKNTYLKNDIGFANLGFAYKIAKNLKIKDNVIFSAINDFKGLPHRQEVVFSNKRVTCVNDSKATSFDACFQSLKSFNNIYWIVGGLPKYKDNFYLSSVSKKIKKVYIIGKKPKYFLDKVKNLLTFSISNNLNFALKNILQDIKNNNNKHNTILLSPAGASFDQFNSFEDRGNHFKNLIKKKINKIKNV